MNELLKRRLVGAGVLVFALLVFALLFFKSTPEPILAEQQQASDLADVRTYEIEVPAVPEREPSQILEEGPPIGTLLPGPAAKKDSDKKEPAKPKKSATTDDKPKAANAAAQPSPVPDVGWSVQVGSFASRDNADGLQKRLKDKGYPAFVYRNASENPPLHRVRVGPYTNKGEAETASQRLREELKLDVAIVSNG